jgi:hypothetical protein
MSEHKAHDSEALVRGFSAREPRRPLRQDCPASGDVHDAAAGGLDLERRHRIIDHVTVCAECARAWRLAAALQPAEVVPFTVSTSRRPCPPTSILAAAASIVLVVSAVFLITPPTETVPPGYRDGGGRPAPVSRLEDTTLPRDEFRLRWSAGPPDATYTLRLTDATLKSIIVEHGLTATEFVVPAATLDRVESGSRLLWQVEMRLPGGVRRPSGTYVAVVL